MPVHLLVAGRKIGTLIAIYFPVLAVNIAVNYFGIPKYGFMVCAFSSVLSEILAMQRSDGGFGYWPNSPVSFPWATAYALIVMDRARLTKGESSAIISPSTIQAALKYLEPFARGSRSLGTYG